MGLDLYKMKVLKKVDFDLLSENEKSRFEPMTKYEDEDNISTLNFFKKFNDYIVVENVEFYDFESKFKELGLDSNNYKQISYSSGEYDENDKFDNLEYFEFQNETNKDDTFKLYTKNLKTIFKPVENIYVKEIGYQRKGMKYEFYKEFYGSCWYVNGNDTEIQETETKYFVIDNEDLNQMKQYAENDEPIKSWKLENDEFIYISA